MNALKSELKDVLKTTAHHFKKLGQMGIHTVEDLLLYYPRAIEEVGGVSSQSQVQIGVKQTLFGRLENIRKERTPRGKFLFKASLLFSDGTRLPVVWFRAPYQLRSMPSGAKVYLTGQTKRSYGVLQVVNPELNLRDGASTQSLRAIYPESPPITSKWLREKISPLLVECKHLPDMVPASLKRSFDLMPIGTAAKVLHAPASAAEWKSAKRSIAFQELFGIQLKVLWQKKMRELQADSNYQFKANIEAIKSDIESLPFALTFAQKRTLFEVLKDFEQDKPASRLVQGDVGSGKTVVSLLAANEILRKGWQVAFMAPTEILAQQHFETAQKFFGDTIRLELLTGSVKASEKKRIKAGLANGSVQVAIGTHALITDTVAFHQLALAIIDEQHRFGVQQRNVLAKTGAHIVNMTATPIPRSLALTLYGDQDISVIDEKPLGRKPPITRVVADPKTQTLCHRFIDDQIEKGRQVFWICPLVEVSETIEAKSVIEHYEHVSNDLFPNRRVLMLHGKMSPKEKESIMQQFKDTKADILVSTSVIEVGVDIPNATAMVIENSERFGLSQLHQFRGRIGRNAMQSYCFLLVGKPEQKQKERLRAMEQSHDGFYLSEVDLKLRGAGELYGLRQSGLPDLKCAELTDTRMMQAAREGAKELLATDPELQINKAARRFLEQAPVYTS